MANLVPKTSPAAWMAEAVSLAKEEGFARVKIDRLAHRLGVTRGGFYYFFANRADLLARVLQQWRAENVFVDAPPANIPPKIARAFFRDQYSTLISETRFDPDLDLAIREWARFDAPAREALAEVEEGRLRNLNAIFIALGYDGLEAQIRAEAIYLHQMGFYALGYHRERDTQRRMKDFDLYLRVVTGDLVRDN